MRFRAKRFLSEMEQHPQTVPELKPLKLVIMSATLNVDELLSNAQLFPDPVNVINIKTKTYPVNVYYNKESPDDLYEDIVSKVCKIHRFLPKGGVLIFLPGKKEIMKLLGLLEEALPDITSKQYSRAADSTGTRAPSQVTAPAKANSGDSKQDETNSKRNENEASVGIDEQFDINEDAEFNPEEIDFEGDEGVSLNAIKNSNRQTYRLLPLYSKLDSKLQTRIFETSEQSRSIVISTNVAETSLTIPGLKFLVDSGLEKTKIIHPATQAIVYKIQYISKASALQRQGRVGRTTIGHCYRVYTPGVFDKMRAFREPEIRRVSLHHLILQLLMVGVRNLFKFPFITKPKTGELQQSLKHLVSIGAIELSSSRRGSSKMFRLTRLGETLSHVPLEPLHAKMLLLFRQKSMLVSGVFIVCALVFEDPLDFDKLKLSFQERYAQDGEDMRIGDKRAKYKAMLANKFREFASPISDLSTRANLLHCLVARVLNRFARRNPGPTETESETEKTVTETQVKRLADDFSLIVCDSNALLSRVISDFCEEYWLINKILVESCKFCLQMVKLFLSMETDPHAKQSILSSLESPRKISKTEQNRISEILVESVPHQLAFKKTLIVEERKVTKVFDEGNCEVRVHNSSMIKRNCSFYLYSAKTRIGDKTVISGLTKILNPSVLLRHCPEFTELKVNVKEFSGLSTSAFGLDPKLKVNSIFGKGRWESRKMIVSVSEIERIYAKNAKRVELLEELRKVDDLCVGRSEEAGPVLDERGLVASEQTLEGDSSSKE